MTKKNEGMRIATKEEAYWEDVKLRTNADIENLEKQLKFLKAVLELSEKKIKDEQDK